MSVVGIISNTAALSAQGNLEKANFESQASIQRLSSGFRIDRPATDVAGLAVGTILQTNITALKAAQTNAAQANSLLGVAAGALKSMSDILQRQKALASQATSGSLDKQARGYLDLEFQGLKVQIDQVAESTNFNGIKLLDGSLFAPSPMTNKAASNSAYVQGSVQFKNALADTKTIDINGVTFTAKATLGNNLRDIAVGGTAAASAENLYNAINKVLNSIDPADIADKNSLAGFSFELDTDTIKITSKSASSIYNAGIIGSEILITGGATAGDILVNGNDAGAGPVALSTGGVAGSYGDLPAGAFNAAVADVLTRGATTAAQGIVSDSILAALNPTDVTTTGIDTSRVSNNPDFVGKISGFKATYTDQPPGFVNLEVTVGDYTYSAKNVPNAPAVNTIIRLASVEAGGGSFDIRIQGAGASGETPVTNQAEADAFSLKINKAFEGVTIYQRREIDSYVAAGTIYPAGSTTPVGNLTGSKFRLVNSDFSNLMIEDVKVTAGELNIRDAEIRVTINGEEFVSGYDAVGATTALGSAIIANATIALKSYTNPSKLLIFTNGATVMNIDSFDRAEAIQKAFQNAFNIKNGGSGLMFQIGTKADDIIQVQIQGAKSEDLYKDAVGRSVGNLNIETQINAQAAGTILDNAINLLISINGTVGALQSRFDYVSANIKSSVINQDSARSTFEDTDVPSESTNYSQSQVRLQASISVLTQANQLPQSLLKLISG